MIWGGVGFGIHATCKYACMGRSIPLRSHKMKKPHHSKSCDSIHSLSLTHVHTYVRTLHQAIRRRAEASGVSDLRYLSQEEARALEPHVRCTKVCVCVYGSVCDVLVSLDARVDVVFVGIVRVCLLVLLNSFRVKLIRVIKITLCIASIHIPMQQALFSPSTGIIDSHQYMLALLGDAEARVCVSPEWSNLRHSTRWCPCFDRVAVPCPVSYCTY